MMWSSARWVVVAALVALAGSTSAKMQWAPCAGHEGKFTPTSVELSPDPAVVGKPVQFTIKGSNEEVTVHSGDLKIDVSFAGTSIFNTKWDLCGKIGGCPKLPGDVSINYEQVLPPIAPPGPYRVQLIAQDNDIGELLCLDVDFEIVEPNLLKSAIHSITKASRKLIMSS